MQKVCVHRVAVMSGPAAFYGVMCVCIFLAIYQLMFMFIFDHCHSDLLPNTVTHNQAQLSAHRRSADS